MRIVIFKNMHFQMAFESVNNEMEWEVREPKKNETKFRNFDRMAKTELWAYIFPDKISLIS